MSLSLSLESVGGGELLGKYTGAMASRDASLDDSAMIMSVIISTIIKSGTHEEKHSRCSGT